MSSIHSTPLILSLTKTIGLFFLFVTFCGFKVTITEICFRLHFFQHLNIKTSFESSNQLWQNPVVYYFSKLKDFNIIFWFCFVVLRKIVHLSKQYRLWC